MIASEHRKAAEDYLKVARELVDLTDAKDSMDFSSVVDVHAIVNAFGTLAQAHATLASIPDKYYGDWGPI